MIDGGLRKLFKQHLPLIHWVSIETGGTGRGIPDSNGCVDGVEFWVEFKRTVNWTVPMRPEQCGWLMRRSRAGGRCFIAVRRKTVEGPRKGVAVDQLWLYPGVAAPALHDRGLRTDTAPLGRFEDGPARWAWPEIGRILTAPKGQS